MFVLRSRRYGKKMPAVFVLLLFSVYCAAQEKVKVQGLKAECIISNITPEQARERALAEAKREALRRAGVSEIVMSADVLYSSADGTDMKQAFNSFSTIELTGEVLDYEIVSENKRTDQFGNFIVELVVDATVIKYETKADPEFDIKVDGVEEFYKEGTNLQFTLTPFKDGYLRLFYFDGNKQCAMIYPNDFEKSFLFKKDVVVKFPMNSNIEYTMETEKEREENYLVFVYTKKDIPFTDEVNYKNLMKWINGITPDQRIVRFFAFIIRGSGN